MKKLFIAGIFLSSFSAALFAQSPVTDSSKFKKLALFVPLFLDDAFNAGGTYKLGKNFPRQSLSGLEFYEGVSYAIDSLEKSGIPVELYVFDTRSSNTAIPKIASGPLMDSLDLIIGVVSGNEFLQLAYLAKQKKIPFISATYPNDGGIRENPYVIIVNSKLNSHIQSIYNFLRREMGTNKLVWFRRKSAADDRLEEVFRSFNSSPDGGVLNIRTVVLPDKFSTSDIKKSLDSLRHNVILSGSLDEKFATTLVDASASLPEGYQVSIVGMPTWEGIGVIQRTEYNALPIIYSTTYYNPLLQPWVNDLDTAFRRKTYSKPSDMFFKGYEITYYFSRLLNKYDSTFLNNLSDPSCRLLTDFEFKPIRWSPDSQEPDYYENKRIFIVKRQEGTLTRLY